MAVTQNPNSCSSAKTGCAFWNLQFGSTSREAEWQVSLPSWNGFYMFAKGYKIHLISNLQEASSKECMQHLTRKVIPPMQYCRITYFDEKNDLAATPQRRTSESYNSHNKLKQNIQNNLNMREFFIICNYSCSTKCRRRRSPVINLSSYRCLASKFCKIIVITHLQTKKRSHLPSARKKKRAKLAARKASS